MAKTPRNILQPLGAMYPDGATERQIKSAFLRAGYGLTKFKKWWALYLDEGIIYPTSEFNDNRERIYDCTWWY